MGGAMARWLTRIDHLAHRYRLFLLLFLVAMGLALTFGLPVPLAALIVGAAAGIALLNPAVAVAAVLAATPFIVHPVAIGSQSFTLLELMLLAGAAGTAGRLIVEVLASRDLAPPFGFLPSRGVLIAGALLLVVSAISLTRLADPEHRDASLRAFRTVIIEPMLVVPAVIWTLRRRRIDLALFSLAVTLGVCTAWGVGQIISGSGVAADGVRRATGPYSHPNNLAFFLERATLLAAIPALLAERFRIIGVAILLIGVAGVLATLSRGALMGLPAGLVIALWLTGRLRAISGVVAGVIAAAGLLALFAGERLFDLGGDGTEPSRLVIWDGAARILRDFPVSGIGLDQFYVMYGRRYIEPVGWPERYTSHPHNLFLDFWLSLGLAGLLLVLIALALLGWRTIALRRAAPSGLAVAGAAALTAAVVHGLVDNAFFLPDLALLTWFSIVLLIDAPRFDCKEAPV
jgi:O-antigen ligase